MSSGKPCVYDSIGAIVIFLEIRAPSEEQKVLVHRYASFMHSYIGRGVCEFIGHHQQSLAEYSGHYNLLTPRPVYLLVGVLMLK